MKDIPKHILITIIVMVVVGLLGGGAWFWTSKQLDQKLEEKNVLQGEIQAVETKGLFPSTQNKKILEDQKNKLIALDESIKPELKEKTDLFSTIRTVDTAGVAKGLDPDAWKKVFGDKRQALRQVAKDKKLGLPEEYNFAFKSYVLAAPRAEHTGDLGVQLLTVEELSTIVAHSGLESLLAIKRSMIEESHSSGGGGSSGNDEALNAKVLYGPEELYRVFPFEVTVKGDPQALVNMLNGLASSKFFFVIRFIYVENEKSSVPKRSEITAPVPAATESQKILLTVAGQEKITARIRVDLIDFLPAPAPVAKNPKAKK